MYLCLDRSLPHDPRLVRFAKLLGVDRPTALGHLVLMWQWCQSYCQDGDVRQVLVSDLAKAAGWEGNAAFFSDVLVRSGWIERSATAHRLAEWGRIGTRSIKEQARHRRYQAGKSIA